MISKKKMCKAQLRAEEIPWHQHKISWSARFAGRAGPLQLLYVSVVCGYDEERSVVILHLWRSLIIIERNFCFDPHTELLLQLPPPTLHPHTQH